MKHKVIIVFDPSIGGFNRGDEVIYEAVNKELNALAAREVRIRIYRMSLHQKLTKKHRNAFKKADIFIIAGSNMVNLRMWPALKLNRWAIVPYDALYIKNAILIGVGWADSKDNPNLFGRWFYKKVLAKDTLHSVRDRYTKDLMGNNGFFNVVNTGCPSMWCLNGTSLSDVPRKKAVDVVTTLTDYRRDIEADKMTLGCLKKMYRKVYLWPQGLKDIEYLQALRVDGIQVIGSELTDYDELLASNESLDYIGTRLHGGIRALQYKRRSIIIAVDHRAIEIGRDTGLPVIPRYEVNVLADVCKDAFEFSIEMPENEIRTWRESMRQKLCE